MGEGSGIINRRKDQALGNNRSEQTRASKQKIRGTGKRRGGRTTQ